MAVVDLKILAGDLRPTRRVGAGVDHLGHDVHPLAIFVFLRSGLHARGWWVRPCAACGRAFATPGPSVRLCAAEHRLARRALATA